MVAAAAVPARHASPADNVSHSLKGETLAATLWLGRAFNNISEDGPSKRLHPIFRPHRAALICAVQLASRNFQCLSASGQTETRQSNRFS
jgi:hypothetical protein